MDLQLAQRVSTRVAHDDIALAALAERVERRAWEDMVAAAPSWLRVATGLTVEDLDGALLIASRGIRNLLVNRTIGLGHYRVATHAQVGRIMDRYWELGVPHYWIHVGAHARPVSLGRLLIQHGLRLYPRSWVKMIRPARRIPQSVETRVRVRLARMSDAPFVASIVGQGFDFSQLGAEMFSAVIDRERWKVYVAELHDQVVGAAGVFIEGSLAYLAFAATRPEYRRLGAQRALMRERINLAVQSGCHWVVTETGFPLTADEPSPSYDNMLWAGFRPVGMRDIYAPSGTSWQVQ